MHRNLFSYLMLSIINYIFHGKSDENADLHILTSRLKHGEAEPEEAAFAKRLSSKRSNRYACNYRRPTESYVSCAARIDM
jgi:hypothetical protein